MPDPIREPGTGKGADATAPKGTTPPQLPGRDTLPATVAEQGRPLPIVYGTCKVPLQLIEKFAPTAGNYPGWTNSTSYVIGQRVTNRGHVYEALNAGISGTTGGPTGTDASISDGTVTWKHLQKLPMPVYSQYFAAALCEGEVTGAVSMWWDKEKITAQTAELPGKHLTLLRGRDAVAQTVPPSFDQSGYQRTAVLLTWAAAQTFTGTQKELPEIALELKGVAFGATTPDVNPADIIADLLTHSRRGLGLRSTIVGDSISGAGATSYRTYCDALGLRLSMLLDTQRNVLEIIAALLLATNTEACYSGDELKCVPLGDQATTAPVYGSTNFVPDTTAVYNLGLDDFLDRDAPVQIRRRSDADCFNSFPVEYTDRAQGYARVTAEDPDLLDIEDRGLRRGETIALPVTFPNGERPIMLSRIAAQRSSSPDCRNEYTFRLPWRYVLLEPLDVVTLTEPKLGLALKPVRIRSISEEGESLTVIADDFPAGVAAAASYVPQASDGYTPQERLTTQEIPSLVDGARMGLGDALVGPASENLRRRQENLIPNGEFLIWSGDRTQVPPDAWEVGASASASPPFADFVPAPLRWTGSSLEPHVYFSMLFSEMGDVSVTLGHPSSDTYSGTEATVLRLRDSALIPVAPDEIFEFTSTFIGLSMGANWAPIGIAFLDVDKNIVDYVWAWTVSSSAAWTHGRKVVRAPLGAAWARVFIGTKSASVPLDAAIDRVALVRIPPLFRAAQMAAQSIQDGTSSWKSIYPLSVAVNGGANDGDCFDTTTGVFTAPAAGFYSFEGAVGLDALPTTSYMFAALAVNGTVVTKACQMGLGATAPTIVAVSARLYLSAGATVALRVKHNGGTALNTSYADQDTYFAGSGE